MPAQELYNSAQVASCLLTHPEATFSASEWDRRLEVPWSLSESSELEWWSEKDSRWQRWSLRRLLLAEAVLPPAPSSEARWARDSSSSSLDRSLPVASSRRDANDESGEPLRAAADSTEDAPQQPSPPEPACKAPQGNASKLRPPGFSATEGHYMISPVRAQDCDVVGCSKDH